jgi:hypothetical protein
MKETVVLCIISLCMFLCSVELAGAKEERVFKDVEIRYSEGATLPEKEIVELEQRVKTYWDARMEGNAVKMYELEDPDVIKDEKLTLTGYIRSKSPAIVDKKYEVKGLEVLSPEKVRVYIILNAFINLPQVMREEEAVIRDIWQKKEGNWYRWLVLNPFSILSDAQRKGMDVKPYKGPLGTDVPTAQEGTENPPVQQEIPGSDSKKEQ